MNQRVVAVVVGSLLALAVAPWIGQPLPEGREWFVLTELRLPRVLLGALVGATLAISGAAYQSVFENPLATPSTIGTEAGASLGALLVLLLFPGATVAGPWVTVGAFVGAAGVSFGVASVAVLPGVRSEDLLLAGISATVAAGALTTGLQVSADAATTQAAVRWALGSVATVGFDKPLSVAAPALLGAAAILSVRSALEVLAGGADRAATQGVSLAQVRARVLGLGSLAVAACVAATGPIAFVGLLVPHLVRLAVGANPRRLVPLSWVAGAAFLPVCDGVARVLLPGRELPVGVLTAGLGAPALIFLLIRRR
jgi:iron complex transport system permease protein